MSARIIEPTAPRVLPKLTEENRAFWTGGEDGELLIQRCERCDRWVHPPTDRCPGCGGELVAKPVSGRGTVFTFTLNDQQFHPDVQPPNLIALIELVEQQGLRVPTEMVDCPPEEIAIGLPVQVLFERHGEVFVPLFEPVRSQM